MGQVAVAGIVYANDWITVGGGVTVYAYSSNGYTGSSTTTDSNGFFHISGLTEQPFWLARLAPGTSGNILLVPTEPAPITHRDIVGVSENQHHNQKHLSEHHVGGSDVLSLDLIPGTVTATGHGDQGDDASAVHALVSDADADTLIQLEESADEDIIRFDVGGAEKAIIDSTGLDVSGTIEVSSHVDIEDSNELRFYDGGGNYVGFEAPALVADQIWILPTADGGAGEQLTTDGGGTLSWAAAGAGAGQDLVDDTLWAQQGDLVYATGDDAAAILSFNYEGDILRLNATIPYWDTPGIADTNPVVIDGTANDNEHATFNAAGIDGLTDAELLAALTGDAGAAFSWNSQNLTSVGTIGCGAITSTAGIIAGSNIESDTDDTDDLGTTSKRWGNLHLGHDVKLDSTPDADHETSGITAVFTANENQAIGDVCYIDANSEMHLADADAIATSYVVGMCADATIAADAAGDYLLFGIVRDDTWNWTVGAPIFLTVTGTTTNTLSQTAPSGADDCVVIVGVATHADRMLFNPVPQAIVEHTG